MHHEKIETMVPDNLRGGNRHSDARSIANLRLRINRKTIEDLLLRTEEWQVHL